MSELKADNTFVFGDECLAYKKSEVDKVIAMKDKEIAELEKKRDYTIEHTAEVINAQEREIRHHKYKRCLAMAKIAIKDDYLPWNMKWHKRWLELAEKFKEA